MKKMYKNYSLIFLLIILYAVLGILPISCAKEQNYVYFVSLQKAYQGLPNTTKLPMPVIPDTSNPHPEWIQETYLPEDRMFLFILVTDLKKESVTFSRYTIYCRETGHEIEVGSPNDLGPFTPDSGCFVAQDHPWQVPENPGTYELRVYLSNEVVTSAVFEVVKTSMN